MKNSHLLSDGHFILPPCSESQRTPSPDLDDPDLTSESNSDTSNTMGGMTNLPVSLTLDPYVHRHAVRLP